MIAESDITACCRRVAKQDIADHPRVPRSASRSRAENAIVRHTLHGLQLGKSGLRLRMHVLRCSRIEAGLSIQAWLMIASLLVNVTRIVVAWWRERQK